MSRVKIKLQDQTPPRVIFVETAATIGADIGIDLRYNGQVQTLAQLQALFGSTATGGGAAPSAHRLLTGLTVGNDHPQYVLRSILTGDGDLFTRDGGVIVRLPVGAEGQDLRVSGGLPTWVDVSAAGSIRMATWVSGSGPVTLPTNVVFVRAASAGTITKVTIMTTGGTGSCVVDIWKDTYAAFPPTGADSICGASKPTIAGGTKYEDAILTGWTTAVAAGDVIAFNLDSTSVFTAIFVQLEIS